MKQNNKVDEDRKKKTEKMRREIAGLCHKASAEKVSRRTSLIPRFGKQKAVVWNGSIISPYSTLKRKKLRLIYYGYTIWGMGPLIH